MIRGFYSAVSGMITCEAKQDVITNNIANANTVGFKNDDLSVKKFNDVLIQHCEKEGNHNVRKNIGKLCLGSKIDDLSTKFTQGMINNTGKPTDFALEGRGFFQVKRVDNGEVNYTRNGHFHVNTKGILVDDMGNHVLANNGQDIKVGTGKIQMNGNNGDIRIVDDIDANGVKTSRNYKMDLMDCDLKHLKKVGDNMYKVIGNTNIRTDGRHWLNPQNKIMIKNSCLEKSNVNVVREMIDMMTVMRAFESNQKVIQSIDETLGKTVNEVGAIR